MANDSVGLVSSFIFYSSNLVKGPLILVGDILGEVFVFIRFDQKLLGATFFPTLISASFLGALGLDIGKTI